MDFTFIIIVIVILGGGLLFLIGRRKKKLSISEESFIRNQWRMIGLGRRPKEDIIEADKLLDYALKKYGYQGSLSEKLKKSAKLFSNISNVWSAHKLRNRIAHEIDFTPSEIEVKSALKNFERAFKDLKITL